MNKCHVWKCIGFALLSLAVVAMGFVFYFLVQYNGLDKNTVIWVSIAGFFTVMAFAVLSKIIISYLVETSFDKKSKKHLLFLSLFISPDYFFTAVGKDIASSKYSQNQDCIEQLKANRKKKDILIITFNIFNITVTVVALFILIFFYKNINGWIEIYLVSIITFRFISRVLEIIIAFGIDVIGNVSHGGSTIKLIGRICLAVSSIIELFLLTMIAYLLLSSSQCNIFDALLSGLTGDSCSCCQCVSSSVDPCSCTREYYLTTITIASRLAMLFIISFVILEYIKIWRSKNKAEILYVNEAVSDKTIPVITDTLCLEEDNKIINSYIWNIPIGKQNIRILFNDHYYHSYEIAISNKLSENLQITDATLNDLEINNASTDVLEVKITFFKRDSKCKNLSVTIEPLS